jgi:hypothetical protein
MGNNKIVRVASADSQAKLCLLSVINSLFTQSEFAAVAERNLFVSYPRESNLTAKLSVKASARVIWGGDESVQAIRAIQSHPRCRDISFADRYSACLINGDELNTDEKINELATKLWQDTEPHSQQACSSPKMVFWLGNTAQQKALFEHINQLASKKSIASNQLNNHLVTSQLIQSQEKSQQNIILKAICAIPINIFNESILEWHNGAGLFLVLQIKSVESLTNIVTDKLQTLSYWQIKKQEILKLVNSPSIQGIDRIVPVGQALDFNPDWDGYRLLTDLSRHITVG